MKHNLFYAGAICLGLVIAAPVGAADFFWNVTGPADWNDGANWDTGTVPSGGPGNNAFVNNGGTVEISSDIPDIQDPIIGRGAGNSGTLNQTAGNIPLGGNGWMFVGDAGGTGTYNLSGGSAQDERLYVGAGGGSVGTLNMSGTGNFSGSGTGDGELNIGIDGATATASFSGNASVQTGLVQFGNANVSITDDVVITAKGEVWFGNGGGATATVDMDSGVVTSESWIAIGRDNSTGTLNLSGDAQLLKTGDNDRFIALGGVGDSGGGVLNISDNALVDASTGLIVGESAGRTGVVNQMGGTVRVHDFAGGDDFGDSLYLDRANQGASFYNLSGGLLDAETVDATQAGSFVMTGGTFSATNFKGDLDQGGGTVSPGNSPGLMTITGNYSLTSGDILMEIEGATAGAEYDQLIVTGDVSLAGVLDLAGAYAASPGDIFTLIDNQGANAVSGIFTGLAEGSVLSFNGVDLTLSYLGGDGNDVTLSAPVPEPTALAVLALAGLVGFGTRRRR